MSISHYLANFFAGLFLCNCLPHLASGLRGDPFPTPFARPPGRGDSSSVVNFLWGGFNLLVGTVLVVFYPIFVGLSVNFCLFVLGFLIIGILLSRHFEKVRKAKNR
jgi:hypothetical protein